MLQSILSILSLCVLTFVNSQNLVKDPGFEAGGDGLGGVWTSGGDFSSVQAGNGVGGTNAFCAGSLDTSAPDTLTQTITGLTIGAAYRLSFFAKVTSSDGPYDLRVRFGKFTLDVRAKINTGYQHFSLIVSPTKSSLDLTFSAYDLPGEVCIDNVALELTNLPAASGVAARKAQQNRIKRHQQFLDAHQKCPITEESCPVLGADGKAKIGFYECIDTTTELNSCGGCIGSGGLDCETQPGVLSAGCAASACIAFSCHSGWKLVNAVCVKQ